MKFKTAGDLINQVAVEAGLPKSTDPYASIDPAMVQLVALLSTCGNELFEEFDWQTLRREVTITTKSTDSGIYPLPADFAYMIPQTGWERTGNNPLFGPLSPQTWAYLKGRDLVSSTIYASFRLTEGKLYIFPQPPPAGLNITYEYISTNWVMDSQNPGNYLDAPARASDTVLYIPRVISRLLKLRFLQARGFANEKETDDFLTTVEHWKGRDKSSPVLNAGGGSYGYPYLNPWDNVADTRYGDY